jgi:adenine deaminase
MPVQARNDTIVDRAVLQEERRMTLYLKNATYIDWKTLGFQSTHLAVTAGVDGSVELLKNLPPENELSDEDSIFDCHNRLVTKSFVCGHHHIYSALARGMPPPAKIRIRPSTGK